MAENPDIWTGDGTRKKAPVVKVLEALGLPLSDEQIDQLSQYSVDSDKWAMVSPNAASNQNPALALSTAAPTQDPAVRQVQQASCSISIVQIMDFLALIGLEIRAASRSCPAHPGDAPWGIGPLPQRKKACLANSAGIMAGFSTIGALVSAAAAQCGATLDLKAACSFVGWLVPVVMFRIISGATVAASVCTTPPLDSTTKAPSRSLMDPSISRRLQVVSQGLRVPGDDRKVQMAECVLDVAGSALDLANMGIFLNQAVISCPPRGDSSLPGYDRNQALCAVNIASFFFLLARSILFAILSVVKCSEKAERNTLCLAAAEGLFTAVIGLVVLGLGFKTNCQVSEAMANTMVSAAQGNITAVEECVSGWGRRLSVEETNDPTIVRLQGLLRELLDIQDKGLFSRR